MIYKITKFPCTIKKSLSITASRTFSVTHKYYIWLLGLLLMVGYAQAGTITTKEFKLNEGLFFGELRLHKNVDKTHDWTEQMAWDLDKRRFHTRHFEIRDAADKDDDLYRFSVGYMLIDYQSAGYNSLSNINKIKVTREYDTSVGSSSAAGEHTRYFITDYTAGFWDGWARDLDKPGQVAAHSDDRTYYDRDRLDPNNLLFKTGAEFNTVNIGGIQNPYRHKDNLDDASLSSDVLNNLNNVVNSGDVFEGNIKYSTENKLVVLNENIVSEKVGDTNYKEEVTMDLVNSSTDDHILNTLGMNDNYLVLLIANYAPSSSEGPSVYWHKDYTVQLELSSVPELKSSSLLLLFAMTNILCFLRRKPVS